MRKNKLRNLLLAAVVAVTTIFGSIQPMSGNVATVEAAVSYPKQAVNFTAYTTDKNLTESGSSIIGKTAAGTLAENWEIVYVSDGVYNIVSMNDGKYLTAAADGSVSVASYSGNSPQRWQITGVKKDYDGYYLYYKITNVYTGTALTYYQGNGGVGVASYTGDGAQLWKLNLYGQQGFSANCETSSGEKAANIGGVLGKTVYASDAKTLVSYLDSKSPLTIVVSGTIDMKSYSNTRIRDYKTIVGAYSGGTLQDCQLRTNDAYGATNDSPSDNIVFRNLNLNAVNVEDRILINIWSSRQIWIDHCSFNSSLTRNKDEVGKFIWINTPYDSYYDAKDIGRSPDYVTISYCTFKNRYWTVAYGTQNSETTRCRTTLMYNTWDQNVRRCPQIGNGSGHIYNNYFVGTDSGIPDGCAQIIGGDGSTMVSENCRFQSYYGYEIVGDSNYKDNNSYTAKNSSSTPTKLNYSPKYSSTSWKPSSNYGYSLLLGYQSNGVDTKGFCTTYAGAKTNSSYFKYVTDSDMSGWVITKYSSPFVSNSFSSAFISSSSSSSSSSSTTTTSGYATFVDGTAFMIKNANSGLYMEVEGGNAANNANVQQWGASGSASHNTWRLFSAGDGYYYVVSTLGDTATYVLDVEGRKNTNGANLDIYTYNGGTNQQFKFVKNSDGSYKILTRVSGDSKGVEIVNAYTNSGANVQQWETNGHACQNWILEEVADPGVSMSTNKVYTFKNANSGQLMEIEGGSMTAGANVQQWGDGGYDSQKWILKSFGSGNYYYIRSQKDATYVLRAEGSSNGSNIDIQAYSTKDSAMLFKFCKNLDGSYTIKTRASREDCLVEIANASTSSGANVQQWEMNGHACQDWYVNETTASTSSSSSSSASNVDTTYNGTYYIQSASSGLYLDVYNGLSDNGTNIQQWHYNGYDAQKFQLVGVGDGYYAIKTGASGYKSCLDVYNGSAADGANINQWEYWGGDMQLFKIVDNGDGTVSFLTKVSNNASSLDVYGWSNEAGGNIAQWTYSGGKNQRFVLVKS